MSEEKRSWNPYKDRARHPRQILTIFQISEIRRLYEETGMSYADLGKRFGVSAAVVGYQIRKGRE